jgi:hypothetical protein
MLFVAADTGRLVIEFAWVFGAGFLAGVDGLLGADFAGDFAVGFVAMVYLLSVIDLIVA